MKLLYEKESYKIRGAAFDVYKQLGARHKEVVYQRALEKSLEANGLTVEREKQLPVKFNGEKVGVYVPDIIVNDSIIIEVKAKQALIKVDIQQFWHYLLSTEYHLGFLINFCKMGGIEILRRVYDTAREKNTPRNSALNSAFFRDNSSGFITLLSVLVIGAVATAVATSLIFLGLGSARTSFAAQQSGQARALATACAEEALERIRESSSFSGNGELNNADGICSYAVTSQGGANRAIFTTGTVAAFWRKTRITIDRINPTINIASWQEIP